MLRRGAWQERQLKKEAGMLVTIILSAILILINDIRTIGQFAAFCAFQFFIWILMKHFL